MWIALFVATVLLDRVYTREGAAPTGILRVDDKPFLRTTDGAVCQHVAGALLVLSFLGSWVFNSLHPASTSSQVGTNTPTIPVVEPPLKTNKEAPSTGQPKSERPPEPKYKFDVGGVIFSDSATSNDIRVQLTMTVSNNGKSGYVYSWKLRAKFPSRSVEAIYVPGADTVKGSVNLPTLDGQEFTSDKPTYGLLHFVIPHLSPEEIKLLMDCPVGGGDYPVGIRLVAVNSSGQAIGNTNIPMNDLYKQACFKP